MDKHTETQDTPTPAPQQAAVLESCGGEIAPIIDALVKAQSKFAPITRTREGQQGNRRFRYAPPDEIQRATRPALLEAKLAIVSYLRPIGNNMFVVSDLRLGGNDGFLRSVYPMTPGLATQDRGKEITYGRRYNTNALLDLAVDEDADDTGISNEADAKKSELEDRLEQAKREGRLRRAGDGSVVKPGESTDALPKPEPKKDPEPEPEAEPEAGDIPAGMDDRLAEKMQAAGITAAELKHYYTKIGKHLPTSVEVVDLPADYVTKLVRAENWKKVVDAIKGGK